MRATRIISSPHTPLQPAVLSAAYTHLPLFMCVHGRAYIVYLAAAQTAVVALQAENSVLRAQLAQQHFVSPASVAMSPDFVKVQAELHVEQQRRLAAEASGA